MSTPEGARVRPELQSHDLVPANLTAGIRLWTGATVFFFLGPFFAYLYLRSLNSLDQWRPVGIEPPQGLGAATVVLTVLSAVALVLADRSFGGAAHRRWLPLGWLAFALGLAAVVPQGIAYFRIGFGPADGGYASVFVVWTALTALFTLATMIWLETLLAYGLRVHDQAEGSNGDPRSASNLIRPRLSALAFYWTFVAGLAAVMWVVLYLA
jgi:heme/copper-type cytochrome/quinol oxidase subunit 3